MTVARFVARFFGWLLTPVVAWAASFLGAAGTAWVAASAGNARTQLIATLVGGGLAAALAMIGWFRLLRGSKKLRDTLNVAPDGTPLSAVDEP
jgi:hypothetical protein